MADLTLSAAVGSHHSSNLPADVKTVQTLLQTMKPPLTHKVSVTGTMDPETRHAIVELQRRFMRVPDGRVDPDGRTLMHLNDGYVSDFAGCGSHQQRRIEEILRNARQLLDLIHQKLNDSPDAETVRKVKNIFNIDIASKADASKYDLLRANFLKLRASLNEPFGFKCEPKTYHAMEACFVVGDDPTVHMSSAYLSSTDRIVQAAKLIHERSHTVLHVHHSGMARGGTIRFGEAPDDPKGYSFDQAIGNAWFYEYLSTAMHPDYDATKASTVPIITPSPGFRRR
jgi:hypothetical protein